MLGYSLRLIWCCSLPSLPCSLRVFFSNDFLFVIFSQPFLFCQGKNICHSIFLCTDGGALTVTRVPTRSFRTLLPSVWFDYEVWKQEGVAFWPWVKYSVGYSHHCFLLEFIAQGYSSISFLMHYCVGRMQVCPFLAWVLASTRPGKGTQVPDNKPLPLVEIGCSQILFVVLSFWKLRGPLFRHWFSVSTHWGFKLISV